MDLIDKYIGEAKIPTIDYEKIGPNDWLIYDEGTGEIQKVIKNNANRKIDPSRYFTPTSSKQRLAGVKADYAARKMSWLFLKKNKGFEKFMKTMTNEGSAFQWKPMLGGQTITHKGHKVELRGNDYGWDYEIWKGNKRVKKSKMRQFPNQYDAKMEIEKLLRKM